MIKKGINHIKYNKGFEDRFSIMVNNTYTGSFEGKITGKTFFLQRKTGILFRNTAKTVLFGTISDDEVLYWYGKNRLFVVSMIIYYVFVLVFLLIVLLVSLSQGLSVDNHFIIVCALFFILNIFAKGLSVITSRKEKRVLYNKLKEICGD